MMDRIYQWPGVLCRVYGNRSGAEVVIRGRLINGRIGESSMFTSRTDAAKTIRAIRQTVRALNNSPEED